MPSRLSSLLVRDGLVGVKRMEKAFQRQVIYGGALDTILLEMNLVPEDRLTQYLALASGLPPAARDESSRIEERAVAIVPREIAEKRRAVPLTLEGETLRMLVCSPLEISELEDLADDLDRPLQPLITPEYRWHIAYAAAYGLDAPARFTTLARSLDVDGVVMPVVGRARSVIIEEGSAPRPVATDRTERTPALADATTRMPDPSRRPATKPPTDKALAVSRTQTPSPDTQIVDVPQTPDPAVDLRSSRRTLVGVQAQKPPTNPPATTPARRDGVPEHPVAPPSITFLSPDGGLVPSTGVPSAQGSGDSSGARPRLKSGASKSQRRPPTVPIDIEGRDSPLPVVMAREQIAVSEDRDEVFLTLLRAARSKARWAGLLTVQGGAAVGRVALAEPGLDAAQVPTVLIPLDSVSPFRAVVNNHQPHIGPLASGDPAIDAMILRMGGTIPPSALLLPIVLRDRVVAIVVAHRVQNDLRIADVTELLPLAIAASEALGRLIVKHKSAGYRATQAQAPLVPVDAMPTRGPAKLDEDSEWAVATQPEAPSIETFAASFEPAPTRPIEALLDLIENAPEGHAEAEITEAVERANDSMGALNRRFPGKLRVDRFAVAGRPLRAAQYGGLLELVIRLGSISGELLLEKMAAAQRDVRFYATVCAMELRPRNAVYGLAERLFDQDFGVRACAIEALAGYPVHDLGTALVRVRRAVHSSDPEVVGAAAAAIVELGDVDAVADLIGAIERNDRAGEHARRALVALTAQDFATSERKWRKWHEGARDRSRIEWQIEGLSHKEDAIRENAINVLRRLTGEHFGYYHDLPRREREAAVEKWTSWWKDVGYRRFVQRDDEKLRPTGILPSRNER
ncbi:MAG TPA: hypothetical protein VGM90_39925 [Kofleriaceae bacterium]|jgi:hypothetical protein